MAYRDSLGDPCPSTTRRSVRRTVKSLIVMAFGVALGLGGTGLAAPPSLAAPGDVGRVAPIDTSILADVMNAYNNVYVPTLSVPLGWTGSVKGCTAGAPSAAGLDAIATAYNYMRAMAGLAPVTVDPAMSAGAQAAALTMQATGQLGHWRDPSWTCYDPAGDVNMWNSSEIIATRGDAKAIPLYMLDPGAGNQAMGHRALILSAQVPRIGIGATTNYSAIHQATDTTMIPSPSSYGWPSKGYFPYELLTTTATRWSFYTATGSFFDGGSWVPQSGGSSVWKNGPFTAAVSVTKNGLPLAVSQPYSASNAASVWEGAGIGWDMPAFTPPPAGGVDVYRVTVSGFHAADGSTPTISYDVKVFSATRAPMLRFTLGADMTGDGRGEALGIDANGVLWMFTGTTSGAFGDAIALATGFSDMQMFSPGDLNSDGKPDVLAIDGSGRLWLYPGQTTRALGQPVQVGSGWTGWRLVPVGDLNGDKKPDLLGIGPTGKLFFYAGKGTGWFAARVQVGSGWSSWALYPTGDANRDGKVDILGVDSTGRMYFYAGTGTGRFVARVQVGSGWGPFTVATGTDLTGDGLADVLGKDTRDGSLYFYKNQGFSPGKAMFAPRVKIDTAW